MIESKLKTMRHKSDRYFFNILVGIALVFVFFALRSFVNTRILLSKGAKSKAEVVDLVESMDEDGTYYRPVFQYKDKKYNETVYKSKVGSSPARYKIGEKVTVIFNPDSNEVKVMSFWGLYSWVIVFLGLSLFFLLPAFVLRWMARSF